MEDLKGGKNKKGQKGGKRGKKKGGKAGVSGPGPGGVVAAEEDNRNHNGVVIPTMSDAQVDIIFVRALRDNHKEMAARGGGAGTGTGVGVGAAKEPSTNGLDPPDFLEAIVRTAHSAYCSGSNRIEGMVVGSSTHLYEVVIVIVIVIVIVLYCNCNCNCNSIDKSILCHCNCNSSLPLRIPIPIPIPISIPIPIWAIAVLLEDPAARHAEAASRCNPPPRTAVKWGGVPGGVPVQGGRCK